MDPKSGSRIGMMRFSLFEQAPRALLYSVIAELTFVVLFVVNYSQLIASSITSLNSVTIVGTITQNIGANSGSMPLQFLSQTLSPVLANAFNTSVLWSLLNAMFLVMFGMAQYRK